MADRIMMFIDTSKCIACKACQVACKQWHSLPAEETTFTGSLQNPPDVSGSTLTNIRFTEYENVRGKLLFLFFKNQCRHCIRPKCNKACARGVEVTAEGFVIFNEDCTIANLRVSGTTDDEKKENFKNTCPFKIPRYNETLGRFVKCDFCVDRFNSDFYLGHREGKPTTACEFTCPPGAIYTGPVTDVRGRALARLRALKVNNKKANLYQGKYGRTQVIFLLTETAKAYGVT